MSHLQGHAAAARILADCFAAQAEKATEGKAVLFRMAAAYADASARMLCAIRDEALAASGACTVDHTRLGVPRCPACGAAKTK